MVLFHSAALSQCPGGDVIFSTQQEINDFAAVYPDCKRITGNVVIGKPYGSTDITDLTPLSHLRTIGGHLNILNNPGLYALDGLDSLQTIGDYLNIFNNEQLINLDGMQSLSSVGGNLWLIKNTALTQIAGLRNLQSIDGSLDVLDNASLTSLDGLENIDPASIKPTLGYTLAQNIEVRFRDLKKISNDKLIGFKNQLSDADPISRFRAIIHKPYVERPIETRLLFQKIDAIQDTVKVYQIFDDLEQMARKSKNPKVQWEVKLFRANFDMAKGAGSFSQRVAYTKNLAEKFERKGWHGLQARALLKISFKYADHFLDYEKLFKTYHALEEVLNHLSPEDFPDMAQCYMKIGLTHYRFRDYEEAIRCFRIAAALPITPYNTTYVIHARNNLGLSYQKLHMPDSSDYYFNLIRLDTTSHPIEVWKGIASGNLGNNYYHRGDYEQAIPLLEKDIQIAIARGDWGLAAGSLIPLADIRFKQNKLHQSESLINQARDYIRRSGQTDRLRLLFPIISKWHAAMGHHALAADYLDSTQQASQDYHDKFSALKLHRARQELDANKLQLYQVERERLKEQRNLIMVIILLLFFLIIVFIIYRTKNFRREQALREEALKRAQESLKHARSRLADKARKIRENDKLIHQLRQDFKGVANPSSLQELQDSTILTSEDWDGFKKNFRLAYPGFLDVLNTRHPELTPAETRYLCLMRLGLTTREMATAQGVSPKSINVTTYRIRKKLNLENQEVLEALVNEM